MNDVPQEDDIDIFIYADDITVSCSDKNPTVAKKKMENYLKKLTKWIKSWGLILNPDKTIIQHFTRKRIGCPTVKINNRVILYKKEHTLLGLLLDSPYLNWGAHANYLKRDCMKRDDLMKTLSSSSWGASSQVLRNFYISYIRAKIDYGCVIYGGASNTHLKKLDIIQNTCMRLITGARNTTPILSLQAEAHIPPLSLRREFLIIKQYMKIKYKPVNNKTVIMLNLNNNGSTYSFNSFSKRSFNLIRNYELPIIKRNFSPECVLPPRFGITRYVKITYDTSVKNNTEFSNYCENKFGDCVLIFTDGFKISNNNSESTAAAMYDSNTRQVVCWKLRPEHSVISSELYAIWQALSYVCTMKERDFVIFSDSKSALQLISGNSRNYLDITNKIRSLLFEYNNTGRVILHWVKAHSEIFGNEVADKAAIAGHKNIKSELYELTFHECVSILKKKFICGWDDLWRFNTDSTGKGLFLRSIRDNISSSGKIIQLSNRRYEVAMYRFRTGHVGLNSYLHRFGLLDHGNCEDCVLLETIEHYLLECPTYEGQRERMFRKLHSLGNYNPTVKTILGGNSNCKNLENDIFAIVLEYIKDTKDIKYL